MAAGKSESMPGNIVRLTMNFYFPVDARLRLKIR